MSALTDRDTNVQPTSHPTNRSEKHSTGWEENMPQERQQHKTVVEQKDADSDGKSGTYISPSDAILSPASQKLAGFKQRQINKQSNKNPAARTLFARTASSCSSGFGDVDVEGEKQL